MIHPVRYFVQCTLTSTKYQPNVFLWERYKHWDIKFRKLRAKKVIKIPLPDYDEVRKEQNMTMEEIRSKLKEKGIAPPRKWMEKPIFISATGAIFEPYVPPEGDGKISIISAAGAKQQLGEVGKKGKTYMALRKIRKFEYDFDVPTLAQTAQDIYIKAHTALAGKDEDKLHELVTEKCYPEMMDNVKNKTVQWKFIQSLEPPRVVHIRTQDLITEGSTFAQATVRFHTQQILSVYDRFGRLMHGSEETVKDVLEYVVFEKLLTYEYGAWRIHGKIIPNWMPPRDHILKTFIRPEPQPIQEVEPVVQDTQETTDEQRKEEPVPALSPV